jgi:hypothetical protein
MRNFFVSFLQFCFIGSMITVLGMAIFDVQFPQSAIFLFFFSICFLGFLWFLAQFLLDVRQYSRDGWNFEARKPRVAFQWGEFGGGPDMSPQEMIRIGYPLSILIFLLFSVVFGVMFSRIV